MSGASKLPRSWAVTTIGEVCAIMSGYGFPKALQGKLNGDLPFFKVGDISRSWQRGEIYLSKAEHYLSEAEARSIRAKPTPKDTTAFAKIGAAIALNRRAVLAQPSLIDNNCMGLSADPDHVAPRYLFYYTCTLRFGDSSRASIVFSIRKSDVSGITLPLPPRSEQTRIVARLDELLSDLEAGIAALDRAKAKLKRYRTSVLKAAVEGKLTEQWRAENPPKEPAAKLLCRILKERRKKWEEDQLAAYEAKGKKPPKNWRDKYKEPAEPGANLPALPEGWCWATFGQLYEVKYGLAEPLRNTEPQSSNDLPILSIKNVNSDGQLILDEIKYFPIPAAKRRTLLLCKGDLLFNWRNAPNLIGKTAIFDLDGDYVNASFLLRLRPPQVKLDGQFTWLYANYLRLRGYFNMESHAAVNQSNFNASKTSGVAVPLPPPGEQRRIIELAMLRFSDIDRVEKSIEDNLLRAQRLKQGILKIAFEGKLVSQDLNDEPAPELLGRIKMARESAESQAKGNSKAKRPTRRKKSAKKNK